MKKSSKILILAIFLVLICCVGAASAAEIDNSTADIVSVSDEAIGEVEEVSQDTTLASVDEVSVDDKLMDVESENETSQISECTIYVGQNTTEDGGNGSYDNPFATFNLACDSVNEYKDLINVNIFEGTYYMTPNLVFNTSNLNINGVDGDVILKNSECVAATSTSEPGSLISFGLVSDSANFTMSNVIFDSSDWNLINGYLNYFVPCACDNSNLIFNNCTFTGYNGKVEILSDQKNVNYFFNECKFVGFENTRKFGDGANLNINITFKNCIFTAAFNSGIGLSKTTNTIFDSIWWGQNSITRSYFYTPQGKERYKTNNFQFIRYAVFNVSENYLGNNQYEIIGKLMWNDTTDDDIDKLGPMTVTLSSSSGDLPGTAILQDGTFRVVYNSTASTHDVTAKLDNEIITLKFNTTDITVNTSDIIIGQDQNITVTLPQDFNGTLTIKVNNKTYTTTVDNTNSITYKIPDVLPAGKHVIDVIFADEKNHIYGFNTTTITVLKVSDYDFNATVTPTSLYIGDSASITLMLPSDADGTVSVKVGDNEAKTFNVNENIIIDGFVVGDNVVNITYNGNGKYEAKSIAGNVFASIKPTTINTSDVSTTYDVAKDLVITLKDVDGKVLVNKTVNVVVGTVNVDLTTDDNGQASVDISKLMPNTYTATITFAGDDAYAESNGSANVVVNKIETTITAPSVSTTYNVNKKLIITLKDADGNVLANKTVNIVIGDINVNLTTDDNGQASVEVSTLTPNTYTATITFAGDDICTGSNNSTTVVVNKIETKITAPAVSTTYNVAKKLVITLKESAGVIVGEKVTVKVGTISKTLTTNGNGQVSVDISKLTPKKYTATITFKGDSTYNGKTTTAKVTVNKATPKIAAKATAFKNTKTKKYTVLVKDNKGKALAKAKVTLIVNGVTYKATTISNGQAVFKITKLNKVGKFNAIVKFAGDANYKAISKKTILNVKK